MAAEGAFWLEDLRTWGDGSAEPDAEDDGIEAALLTYARKKASRWGAERFAAEFRRRDEEEQRQLRAEAAERSMLRTGPRPIRRPMMLTGLVDASVEDRVIGAEPGRLEFVGRHRPELDADHVAPVWRDVRSPSFDHPFRLDIRLSSDEVRERAHTPEANDPEPEPEQEQKLVEQPQELEVDDFHSTLVEQLHKAEVEAVGMKLVEQPHKLEADGFHSKLVEQPQQPEVTELQGVKVVEQLREPEVQEREMKLVEERPPVVNELHATVEQPKVMRHPHVPRPPAPAPEPEVKRKWFERRRAEAPSRAPAISPAELARMTPAARRLYGLDQ